MCVCMRVTVCICFVNDEVCFLISCDLMNYNHVMYNKILSSFAMGKLLSNSKSVFMVYKKIKLRHSITKFCFGNSNIRLSIISITICCCYFQLKMTEANLLLINNSTQCFALFYRVCSKSMFSLCLIL